MTQKRNMHRVALVTGAARRIGAAIARCLHADGFNVLIHCHRSWVEAQQLADELNQLRTNSALVVVANLMQLNTLPNLVKQGLAWRGRLDALVNNASLFVRTPLSGLEDDAAQALWTTNVRASSARQFVS